VIKMKRLGLGLMIASLALLVAGQAMALPIFSAEIEITQESITVDGPLGDGLTYHTRIDYTITNLGTQVDDGSIWYVSMSFEDNQYGQSVAFDRYKTIQVPGGPAWDGSLDAEDYDGWLVFEPDSSVVHWGFFGGAIPGDGGVGIFSVATQFDGPIPVNMSQEVSVQFTEHFGSYQGTASTPEPTTLLLIGGGLIAIAGYARIRKKKREV
jgi:hypothetical protein